MEAKRQKMDPDYVPSTASEGTATATHSQDVSEVEEDIMDEATETDEESWNPSGGTSPEIVSSPDSDDSL
jgi:hypothetical protein